MANKQVSAASGKKKTVSTTADWKQSAQGVDLEVPSGNICKARPAGMQVFMERGVIPNSLMQFVRQALKGEEPEIKADEITEDQLRDMMELFDAVTVYCVIEPKVSKVPRDDDGNPIPLSERDQDKLFVDEVDFEDKQFIFQWVVGGTRDLERFREEQSASLERVRPGTNLESKAK